MIEKYEKEESKEELIDGKLESVKEFKEVEKKDAEYVHICYHDEENPRPCIRKRILKV